MELFRRTYAEINIENLKHNWRTVQSIAGYNQFICPMVKANAYGHGDFQVATALLQEGADTLGVCLIEEALNLLSKGIQANILVFRGFDKRGAEVIADNQLTPVVSQWSQLEALESVATDPIKVHLKFNTGMSRLGFEPTESDKLFTFFKNSKKLKLKAILSHLANGDDSVLEKSFSNSQFKKMSELESFFKPLDPFTHLLNTGALMSKAWLMKNQPESYLAKNLNLGCRPGLMLYGYHTHSFSDLPELKPVMSFKSIIENIRYLKVDETVSYGQTWQAKRPSVIGVVPVGYADGVHRLLSNRTQVMIDEVSVSIVGRICMDFLMIDLTDLFQQNSQFNWSQKEVILFGFNEAGQLQSAHQWAEAAETINYEILTSVSGRVPRQYKGLKKS